MKAERGSFYTFATQESMDEYVNSLALTYGEFARMSSMRERLYGVIVHGVDDRHPLDEFVANECVKNNLWRKLQTVQEETENHLGYNMTPRYHFQDIPLPRTPKFALKYPGVEAVEIQRAWTDVVALNKVVISPYLVLDANVVDYGGIWHIQVPDNLFKNPEYVLARNAATGGVYAFNKSRNDYPRRVVDSYWELGIDPNVQPYDVSQTVNLQHREFVRVTITKPSVPTGAVLEPVYYGTHQIIPYVERLDNGATYTYTFNVHELVSSYFTNEVVNLLNGEFYKLEPYISFAYWRNVVAYTELVIVDDCDAEVVYKYDPLDLTKPYPGIKLSHPVYGVVHLCVDGIESYDCDGFYRALDLDPHKIRSARLRIWYKTNPQLLESKYYNQIPHALNASYHKVGAELPLADCGCKIDKGFIMQMQMPYGTQYISPVTNVEIYKTEYGQLHGQVYYKKEMEKLRMFRRPNLLSMTQGV